MLNLDPTTLNDVVEQACRDAAAHGRWLVAIGRAAYEVECNPYMERADHGGLLIGSPSGSVYSANGTCQCAAYVHGVPCWHRAAARLVRLHDEAEAAAAYTHAADAGLFGPEGGANVFPLNLPDDDRVEESNRLARKITAARAKAQMAELFS